MGNRGCVTLVFDDGYELVYDNAVPLLRKYGVPAVFGVPINGQRLEKTEKRKLTEWSKWLPLKDEGFEIASHTVNHHNLTMLNDDDLDYELGKSAEKLGASSLIYPGGALDDRVVEHAKKYYTAGRTVHYGFEKISPVEPLRLHSYNFSRNNFSVLKVNLLALYACLTDSWLIETYHMVDDNDESMVHTVKTRDLERHLKFLAKLPVAKKTIEGVLG